MNTLDRIYQLWDIKAGKSPIEVPNVDRNELATLFCELGYRVGAEIGVEQGAYSEQLLKRNPGLTLYGVDPWQAYRGYREHVSQDKLDMFYEATLARLAPYDFRAIRKYSVEAARSFENNPPIDFVYIDSNHTLPYVIQDLEAWSRVVRPGGIIAGHDYCRRKDNGYQVHVVEAVQAWVSAYHISPWFILGRKEARAGEKRDRPRSWMWVKA